MVEPNPPVDSTDSEGESSSSVPPMPATALAPRELLTLEEAMESVVRITLAGLGGSMLGLSQERKLESMRVVTGAAATAAARRKRAPSAQLANLPLAWAISCMAFCAMIEASRRLAPSSLLILSIIPDRQNDNSTTTGSQEGFVVANPRFFQTFLGTVADFTFGGAMGGFAASMGRNSHLRKHLPSSMLRGSQRFFGVLPGIALGFVAGIVQASTDAGIAYLEEQQQKEKQQT